MTIDVVDDDGWRGGVQDAGQLPGTLAQVLSTRARSGRG